MRPEEELEQGRGSSLEQDEQDELAPLPPPGGPRSGELAQALHLIGMCIATAFQACMLCGRWCSIARV